MAEYEKKVRQKLSEYGCAFRRHGKGLDRPEPRFSLPAPARITGRYAPPVFTRRRLWPQL
jgi:hypothetical protein